jgi:MFS transporter, ACDE family, multidrug resistance protein
MVTSPSDRARRVLPLIYAVTLTGILSNSLLAPAIPDILDHFDKPDSAAGLLVAVGSMPGIVVAPLIGLLADRLGRRAVLVPCMFVFGAFGLVAATAQTFDVLLLARLAMGFGSAGMINLSVVLIGDFFPEPLARTKAIGRNSAILTAGLAIIPLTSGLVTDLAGWRWALAIYGLSLGTGLGAWLLLDRSRPRTVGTVREQLGGAGVAVRNPMIVTTLVVGVMLFALVFGVFLTVLPNHLESQFDLSAGWRGAVIALPAVPSTIMAFNLGRLKLRFGRAATVLACAAGWAVAFSVIAAAPTLGVLMMGTVLYGMGEGGLIPILQDTAIGEAPAEHRGAVVAVWVSSARLGQTIGPLAAGLILASASTTAALWVGAGVAAAMAIGIVFSPLARRESPSTDGPVEAAAA